MHTLPLSAPVENFLWRAPHGQAEPVRREKGYDESLEGVAHALDAARAWVRADQQQFGETGAYTVATLYHVLYVDQARDQLAELREWLRDYAAATEPMHGTMAPYQMHTHLREMALALHYARHWAMLSASYHHSRAAAEAYEQITRALQAIESLSAAAGRAFLAASEK